MTLIRQLLKLLVIGVAAIDVQNRKISHSSLLEPLKVLKVAVKRRTAKYHRGWRLSIANQRWRCWLDIAEGPDQGKDQLLQSFCHVELQWLLSRNQHQAHIKQHGFPHVQYAPQIQDFKQCWNRYRVAVRNRIQRLLLDDQSLATELNQHFRVDRWRG